MKQFLVVLSAAVMLVMATGVYAEEPAPNPDPAPAPQEPAPEPAPPTQ